MHICFVIDQLILIKIQISYSICSHFLFDQFIHIRNDFLCKQTSDLWTCKLLYHFAVGFDWY